MSPLIKACKSEFGEEPYYLCLPRLPEEFRIHAQVLRVCRRFYEIGMPILYNITLMYLSVIDESIFPERAKEQRLFLNQLIWDHADIGFENSSS